MFPGKQKKKRTDCPVFSPLLPILEPYKAVVPNVFHMRNGLLEEKFFRRPGSVVVSGWFK